MPATETLAAFAAATFVLVVVPGPAVMYIVARSASQGRVAGLVSVAGIHAGTTVHVLAAMAGLSALLATSAAAFTAVKLVGAAYLLWLGAVSLRRWWQGRGELDPPAVASRRLSRVFVDGAVVEVLNPKTALFFLAFMPQFVEPGAPHPTLTIGILGLVFVAVATTSDSAYALAGGWVGGRVSGSTAVRRRTDLAAGVTYLGLGALTATTGHRST